MRHFRTALLGCGRVSVFQLRAWAEIEGLEVVALYNRTLEKARERAHEFGIPQEHVYGDYLELLHREQLDFVDIATAPEVHRQQVEAAAACGLHVLCQKPVAPSLEDIHSMLSACGKAGVLFSVNENWRWRGWYREVKSLLERGVIGQPRFMRFISHRNMTMPSLLGRQPILSIKQAYTSEMEQLILFEWGTHLVDVTRFLLGDIRRVYARMDRASPDFKGEDRAVIVLELDQATTLLDISWATVGDPVTEQHIPTHLEHFVLEGDDGLIEILPEPQNLLRVSTRSESYERPAYQGSPADAYQASYTAAQRHFYECLRDGKTPETVASDNLKTMGTVQGAYRSAALGQAVELETGR
jgi:predicted dehydrogenase